VGAKRKVCWRHAVDDDFNVLWCTTNVFTPFNKVLIQSKTKKVQMELCLFAIN
jgi:hypothetical protein